MPTVDLRDDFVGVLGDRRERARMHEAIRSVEREALGLPAPDTAAIRARDAARIARLTSMSVPKSKPETTHSNFLQGPRSRRGRGERSTDAMFHVDPRDRADGVTSFWLYGSQKLTQRTLGSCLTTAMALGGLELPCNQTSTTGSSGAADGVKGGGAAGRPPMGRSKSRDVTPARSRSRRNPSAFLTALDEAAGEDDDETEPNPAADLDDGEDAPPEEAAAAARELVLQEFVSSPLAAALRRRLDTLMATAASRRRCGLLFDLVSTANIIRTGVPHLVGEYIYHYIATQHNDKLTVKFSFIGITDNVNCCAARDVLCRDDWLDGHYIGDTKRREFDALDNVHVFAVFPRPGTQAHFATLGSGAGPVPGLKGAPPPGPAMPPAGAVVPRPSTVMAAKRRVAAAGSSAVTKRITAPTNDALAELRYDSDEDDPEHVMEPERTKKVPEDVKKYIFDRREWAVFACRTPDGGAAPGGTTSSASVVGPSVRASPAVSAARTRRAVSATPGMRSTMGGTAGAASRARPASRAEAMGVTAVDFPPALAQAFRSLSAMA